MPKLSKEHLYLIRWIDISDDNDWHDVDDIPEELLKTKPITSVGYFVGETSFTYAFTSGIDKELKRYFDLTIFPKGAIIELEEIPIDKISSYKKKIEELKDRIDHIKVI